MDAMKRSINVRAKRLSLLLALSACVSGTGLANQNASAEDAFSFFGPEQPADRIALLEDDDQPAQPIAGDINTEIETAASSTGGDMVSRQDYDDLVERFDSLEKSWSGYQDKLKDEADAKKKKPSGKLNGRVHLDNWSFLDEDAGTNYLESGDPTQDPQDRWDFRRIRLTFSGDVPGDMLYRISIDFNNPNSPEMKDVYMGFKNLPHNQQFLIGNQKRPIGLDHLNSSRHNVFIERPLAVETFNEDARRLGACMYGHNDSESVNWRYGAFLLENLSGDGRYRGDYDEAGLYGRLAMSPWYDEISGGRGYYHCAIAGSANTTDADGTIDNDSNSNEARFRTRPLARSSSRWWDTGRLLGAESYQQLAFESMLNIGAFQLTGEYINTWVQRDPLGGFNGEDLHFQGAYLFANYFLTGEHVPLKRTSGTIDRVKPFENFFLVDRCCGGTGTGWGAMSVGIRADYLDLSDGDIRGGDGYAITLSNNWYWTAYSKLQTNLVMGEIDDAGQGRSNVPLAQGVSGDFTILGFRYMIDF